MRRDEGKHFTITSHTKVCSRHFADSDFYPNYASGKKSLKQDAVPSIFNFPSKRATAKRKPPKERGATSAACKVQAAETVATSLPIRPRDETNEDAHQTLEMGSAEELQSPACSQNHQQVEAEADGGPLRKLSRELEATKEKLAYRELELEKARQLIEELKHAKQELFRVNRELDLAKEEIKKLQRKVGVHFSVERFKHSCEDMRFYTGLPSYAVFQSVLKFMNPGHNGENVKALPTVLRADASYAGRPRSLTVENEFFLFLVRLRLGLFEKDLADRFCISIATVSRICITWTSYAFLRLTQLPIWMSKEQVQEEMPPAFKQKYPSTRIILDATEIKCQAASSLALQSATFSTYKSTNTFKGLIGISPDGTLTYVSSLYPGSISDKECVRQSGFLKLCFNEGDIVMADKGFKIQDMLRDINVGLNTPPFLTRGQFSEDEVRETEEIASLRIHVERRIQRIKNFHIFDRPIPLSLGPIINEVWIVCALLTNFQSPIVRAVDE